MSTPIWSSFFTWLSGGSGFLWENLIQLKKDWQHNKISGIKKILFKILKWNTAANFFSTPFSKVTQPKWETQPVLKNGGLAQRSWPSLYMYSILLYIAEENELLRSTEGGAKRDDTAPVLRSGAPERGDGDGAGRRKSGGSVRAAGRRMGLGGRHCQLPL